MQSKGLRLGGCGWTCSGVLGTVIDASREPGLVQLGHDAARYRVELATTWRSHDVDLQFSPALLPPRLP